MSAPNPAAWRVAVVEDNAQNRHFLEHCVAGHPGLCLAASFATLAAAREWFLCHDADLLLIDLGLPDGSGLTLMREVHGRWPGCDMLVVSMFGDEDNVVASIEAGAVGYVHKDDEAADIAETLLAVKQGASPISPMIARHLLRRLRPAPGAPSSVAVLQQAPRPEAGVGGALLGGDTPPSAGTPGAPMLRDGPAARAGLVPELPTPAISLSPREQEVLEYIARGFSYIEIARLQGITVHTVQTYIKKLYGKLAVHSRGEAVFEANRLGLISTFSARGDAPPGSATTEPRPTRR